MHQEVPTKVNAWVDEGVVPLVEALSDVPEIVTLDSCENDNGKVRVTFTTHGGTEDIVDAVRTLSSQLHELESSSVLSLEWSFGGERPLAHLRCRPSDVPIVVKRLRRSRGWDQVVTGNAQIFAVREGVSSAGRHGGLVMILARRFREACWTTARAVLGVARPDAFTRPTRTCVGIVFDGLRECHRFLRSGIFRLSGRYAWADLAALGRFFEHTPPPPAVHFMSS